MRGLTAQEIQVFGNTSGYRVKCRVLIKDGAGTFRDYTNLDGKDWFLGCDWDEDVDQPVAAATVRLVREHAQYLSLSPLRTDSKLFGYVDMSREIKIETACVPNGVEPQAGDWLLVFHGYVDDVNFPTAELELACIDLGSKLQITFIETERDYSNDTGIAVETVMQSILNDNGLSAITLYTPVSPGWNIKKFRQQKQSVLDALTALAYQIGWDVRYKYDSGTSAYRLTFFQPARTKTVVDYSVSPSIYLDVTALSLSRRDIRNAVQVGFYDRANLTSSGEPKFTLTSATDSASITKYGRQWMEITEGASSQIDTLTEANKMRDAALADLKDPLALQDVEMHLFPNVEVGDLLRFIANGVHYTADQDLAVTKASHVIDGDRTRTTVSVRGKPSGPRAQWFQMETRPGVAPTVRTVGPQAPTAVVATPIPGGAIVQYVPPVVGAWDMFELHISTGSGFTPSSSTFKAQGTFDRFVVNDLTSGATYYAKVVPKDASGNPGTASAEVSFVAGYVTPLIVQPLVSFQSIIPNPDFEANNLAGSPPDTWEVTGGAWNTHIVLSTDAYTGTHSVKFLANNGIGGYAVLSSQYFLVREGASYLIDAFVKFIGTSGATNFQIGITWYDENFNAIDDDILQPVFGTAPTTWTNLRGIITINGAPAGPGVTSRYARVFVAHGNENRDAIVDSIIVERVQMPQVATMWYRDTAYGTAMPNSTWVVFDFNTVEYDTHGAVTGAGGSWNASMGSGWKFTAPLPGIYSCKASVGYTGMGGLTGEIIMEWIVNGGTYMRRGMRLGLTGGLIGVHAATDIPMAEGDYVQCRVYQNNSASAAKNCEAIREANWISITRVALR